MNTDDTSLILRSEKLTDHLAGAKNTHAAYTEKYETKVSWLINNSSQNALMRQKTADTLSYASGAVLLQASYLKKVVMKFVKCQGCAMMITYNGKGLTVLTTTDLH